MTVPGTDGATQRRAPRTAVLWPPTSTPSWLPRPLRRRTCWPVTPPAGSTRGSSPACTPPRWREWSCSTLNQPTFTRSFPAGGRSTPLYKRGEALAPSLARVGIARIGYDIAPSGLPPAERAEQEADLSSAEYYRALHDEIAQLLTSLTQAQQVTSFGDKPLIVVTAGKDAQDGWLPLQDEMALLSSNSVHTVLPDVSHASLIEDQQDSTSASAAIIDVVHAVRSGAPLDP